MKKELPPISEKNCKFVPQVCKFILKEFQHEYLTCPTDPEDWKKIEERFRNRWNVPHAVGALDGKHIAMKKPKKSVSEYFNYKGYFSLVLLALVDADYRFLWVNVGASGSSSDAQIFNRSKLKRRIENGTLGLPPPEPLGPWGPELHYFLLGDDAFALMPWLMKLYSRRQLTREERIANYRISRGRRIVKNSFGILVKRFRALLTTMEQRPKVVRDIVLTCVVLHNMLRSYQTQFTKLNIISYRFKPRTLIYKAHIPHQNDWVYLKKIITCQIVKQK